MEKMVIKNILITGGLGCIGRGLSKYLSKNGYKVFIGSSRKNAKIGKDLEQCSLVYTDLSSVDNLVGVCANVDCVIHLAAVNAQNCDNNPRLGIQVNGIGTYNLLQASIKCGIRNFLYFSTAHIYGSPLVGEFDENTIPKPVHMYAITHRLAEDFLLESINKNKMNAIIFRVSNTVGSPLAREANCWMLFVNDICKQAIISRRIVIHSDPNTERDFVSMYYIYKITKHFLSVKTKIESPVFNVGSGCSYSLIQIAEIVSYRCKKMFGFFPEIVSTSFSKDKNLELKYRVDKLHKETNMPPDNFLISSIDEILTFCHTEFY